MIFDLKCTVKFKKLHPNAQIPKYQTPGSAGMDLVAVKDVIIWTDDYSIVDTGLSIEIPEGYEGQVRSRSGLALKFGLAVLNSPGTIDSDYRAEVKVILYNHGPHTYNVKEGDRIAQLVIAPVAQLHVEEVKDLTDTERGEGGFGSTGTGP